MINGHPCVFISYSWTSAEYKQRVNELAERLIHDGIVVKLDIWDLKDGQDKYIFMEKCVTDPDIDHVLILSDKAYANKANNRYGGVGDETGIITPEIYGNAEQQKFIPIVMEKDEQGNVCLPVYLKSRKYKDFTGGESQKAYESLVRTIYNVPLERKPKLGSRPPWLDIEQDEECVHMDVTKSFNGKRVLLYSVAAEKFASARLDIENNPVCCNTDNQEAWEIFQVTVDNEGWASFLAFNSCYLTVSLDVDTELPPIRATASESKLWEKFKIYQIDDRYAIMAKCNGKWLTSRIDKDDIPMFASCVVADFWEMFDIKTV